MSERCVVKILGKTATSFAACHYNEKKVAEGTAKCISMRNCGDLGKYHIHAPVVPSRSTWYSPIRAGLQRKSGSSS